MAGTRENLNGRLKEGRSKLEIIEDILFVIRNGARKTEIISEANLNSTLLTDYIQYLKDNGLLEIYGPLFKTTSKGEKFLLDYQKMREVLLTEETRKDLFRADNSGNRVKGAV